MKLTRCLALSVFFMGLAGCASMSDHYYIAGSDGGGDYYYAPQPQGAYYDPYAFGSDFYYGFGWGSPFGYGRWWNGWTYFPPPHLSHFATTRRPATTDRMPPQEQQEPRWSEARESRSLAPAVNAPERRERSFRPDTAPRARPRNQHSGDPIP